VANQRSGHKYRQAVAALKAQGDTNCWRCGKPLYADAKWPHPNSITLGHLTALEDDGDLLDPQNHAAECINCNSRDGQRRTTRILRARQGHTETTRYSNNDW
jgi:hypothetical protein